MTGAKLAVIVQLDDAINPQVGARGEIAHSRAHVLPKPVVGVPAIADSRSAAAPEEAISAANLIARLHHRLRCRK